MDENIWNVTGVKILLPNGTVVERGEETWIEQIPGELFIIRSPEGIPFEGDDGRAYEIWIKKESDGSISTLVVDETGVADPVRLRDYAEEARRRWSIPISTPPAEVWVAT